MRLTALALCMQVGFLAGCAHDPTRSGVWIVNPTPMVRCDQTAAGVVCKSIRIIPAEDVGI